MSHCVDTMAIFGLQWLAHAYGPVGTIGEERSFLGSPPLPGYPAHSTWPHFPEWNARLSEHLGAIDHTLPESGFSWCFPLKPSMPSPVLPLTPLRLKCSGSFLLCSTIMFRWMSTRLRFARKAGGSRVNFISEVRDIVPSSSRSRRYSSRRCFLSCGPGGGMCFVWRGHHDA